MATMEINNKLDCLFVSVHTLLLKMDVLLEKLAKDENDEQKREVLIKLRKKILRAKNILYDADAYYIKKIILSHR